MWSQPGLSRSSLLYVDGHFVLLSEGGDLLLVKVNPEKFEPVALRPTRVAPADERRAALGNPRENC